MFCTPSTFQPPVSLFPLFTMYSLIPSDDW